MFDGVSKTYLEYHDWAANLSDGEYMKFERKLLGHYVDLYQSELRVCEYLNIPYDDLYNKKQEIGKDALPDKYPKDSLQDNVEFWKLYFEIPK